MTDTVNNPLANDVPAPTLTLTPVLDNAPTPAAAAQPVVAIEEQPAAANQLDDSMLTAEEKQMVEQLRTADRRARLRPRAAIRRGRPEKDGRLQRNSARQRAHPGPRGSGRFDQRRSHRAAQLRRHRGEGTVRLLKKGANKVEALRARYDKAEGNVDKIVKALQGHQMKLMKDAAMLDKMYELNLTYFKELTMYILAGKKKLAQVREVELKELIAKAHASGRAEDAQAAQDLEAMCTRFEKKISDLDLTRTIAMQTAPQIRLVQNNEVTMVEKIQTTIVNTIPLWKSQMVLALGIANSAEAVRAQNAVTNMTNDLLKKNAEMLHTSTVEVARESERGIVDIETLKNTNETLIKTFDEVMQIEQEGRQKRAEAEAEMRRMETELKQKMLEIPRLP